MAFTLAGGIAQGETRVLDCRNVDTSFPGFLGLWNGLGGAIENAGSAVQSISE
jgi:5-enolpyruvylshikimate-3-phosphate synthase